MPMREGQSTLVEHQIDDGNVIRCGVLGYGIAHIISQYILTVDGLEHCRSGTSEQGLPKSHHFDGPKQILAGAPDKLKGKPELSFLSRRGEGELAQAVVHAQVDQCEVGVATGRQWR